MDLIEILNNTVSKIKILFILLLGVIAGIINTYLLYLINTYLTALTNGGEGNFMNNLPEFMITVAFFILFNIVFSKELVTVSQRTIKSLKEDIYEQILKSNYQEIKEHRDNIYTVISTDINTIANSFLYVIQIVISVATLISCFVYLGILSWQLLLGTLGILAIGILLYTVIIKRTTPKFMKSRDIQDDLIFFLNEILNGIKELVVYPKKKQAIKSNINAKLDDSFKYNLSTEINLAGTRIIGQSILFIFLGVLILVVPSYFPEKQGVLLSFSLILLYILRPIEVIMNLIGPITEANIATKKTNDLITDLKSSKDGTSDIEEYEAEQFQSFHFKDIYYAHQKDDEKLFEVGPIDFQVKQNEVVFIYGGNGSGKTTLINAILGIYQMQISSIELNGEPCDNSDWKPKARKIFAPVFSDFHLFDEFYGLEKIDKNKLNEYFKVFEIDHKVSLEENGFSTLDLSMGQRKRLALINALLEDRPILVLDEWAADQDPYFKNKFYTEIISWLTTSENKTIIAITHDDRYFHIADHLFKMEYGKLNKVDKTEMQTLF